MDLEENTQMYMANAEYDRLKKELSELEIRKEELKRKKNEIDRIKKSNLEEKFYNNPLNHMNI